MTPREFDAYPRLATLMHKEAAPEAPANPLSAHTPLSNRQYAAMEALDAPTDEVLAFSPSQDAPPIRLPELPADLPQVLPRRSPFAELVQFPDDVPTSTPHVNAADSALHEATLAAAPTRVLVREAIRARAVDLASAPRRHSAYELVFVMLAFAVMVLLVTPPAVDILLAAHGVRP